MLLVYDMKNTLSIGEIKRILQNLYGHESYDAKQLEEIYARYLSLKETLRAHLCGQVDSFVSKSNLNIENEGDFFTLLLSLSAMSSYLKNTVQILLSAHYPELINEKEREEQEKQEKKEEKEAYVAELKNEIQRLEYMLDAPLDDEFKIRIAREKLGMCFPDEIIFYSNYD